MKIDITPIIETANETDKLILKWREIPAFYVVKLANGEVFSTKFSPKELDEFCPNKTVSEMLQGWENRFIELHKQYTDAVSTGIHPLWTHTAKVMEKTHPFLPEKWTGKYEEVDLQMTKSQIKYFSEEAERLKLQFGKMQFVKIC